MKYNVALVKWLDAQGSGAELTQENLPKPFIVTTVGALIKDVPEYVVLTQDIYEPVDGAEFEFRNTVAIPRLMIQSIVLFSESVYLYSKS